MMILTIRRSNFFFIWFQYKLELSSVEEWKIIDFLGHHYVGAFFNCSDNV